MAAESESASGPVLRRRLGEAIAQSRVVAIYRTWRRRTSGLTSPVGGALARAYRTSAVGRFSRRLGTITRHSFLYRWLTAEPDPEVVVIDLRETWTVGPIIRALDWLATTAPVRRINRGAAAGAAAFEAQVSRSPVRLLSVLVLLVGAIGFATSWNRSELLLIQCVLAVMALAALGLRVDLSWEDLPESRTQRLLRALLTPPDVDERDEGTERDGE